MNQNDPDELKKILLRRIAMAVLSPGWERDYEESPTFEPIGCVGRVTSAEWLPDDRYDVVLEGERRVHGHAAAEVGELAPLRVRERRRDVVAVLDARERPDLVPAFLGPERAQVRELHVRPGLHLLDDVVPVARVVHVVEEHLALRVAGTQATVVEVERAVGRHQRQQVRAERAEAVVEAEVRAVQLLDQRDGIARPADHRVRVRAQPLALVARQRLVDAAGNGAGAELGDETAGQSDEQQNHPGQGE